MRAQRSVDMRTQLERADSLDRDMLDEQSRALLNYARPDEVIILEAPGNRR